MKSQEVQPLFVFKLLQKGLLQGVFWAVMIQVVSSANDVLMRFSGTHLHWIEVSFFRYLFGMLMLLPFMLHKGTHLFQTTQPMNHIWRGLIGCIGLTAGCFAVNHMPMVENTTITFTQPLFFLCLAYFFLKENVNWRRWLCTIVGFLGLLIVLRPGTSAFQWIALVPVLSAVLFAFLDLFAKLMIQREENAWTLAFYFGLATTLFAALPLKFVWVMPTPYELGLLFLLGVGANLIQMCIFFAFRATEASILQPFRYVELITAALFGYVFFHQTLTVNLLCGACVIIASVLFMTWSENNSRNVN